MSITWKGWLQRILARQRLLVHTNPRLGQNCHKPFRDHETPVDESDQFPFHDRLLAGSDQTGKDV